MYYQNMHSTNIKGHKKIQVPKVEKSCCDSDMLDNLNSKYDIEWDSSSHTTREINMISYSTPTKYECSSYSNKNKNVSLEIICKSLKPTFEIF